MPVVTTLFRNLFDIIFTIFYGCRTVFNGVGPVIHPATTIWSSVGKVDSVLHHSDLDRPRSTARYAVVPTLRNMGLPLCARVACVYVCALCMCVLYVGVCSMLVCVVYLCVDLCVHFVVLTLWQ